MAFPNALGEAKEFWAHLKPKGWGELRDGEGGWWIMQTTRNASGKDKVITIGIRFLPGCKIGGFRPPETPPEWHNILDFAGDKEIGTSAGLWRLALYQSAYDKGEAKAMFEKFAESFSQSIPSESSTAGRNLFGVGPVPLIAAALIGLVAAKAAGISKRREPADARDGGLTPLNPSVVDSEDQLQHPPKTELARISRPFETEVFQRETVANISNVGHAAAEFAALVARLMVETMPSGTKVGLPKERLGRSDAKTLRLERRLYGAKDAQVDIEINQFGTNLSIAVSSRWYDRNFMTRNRGTIGLALGFLAAVSTWATLGAEAGLIAGGLGAVGIVICGVIWAVLTEGCRCLKYGRNWEERQQRDAEAFLTAVHHQLSEAARGGLGGTMTESAR